MNDGIKALASLICSIGIIGGGIGGCMFGWPQYKVPKQP